MMRPPATELLALIVRAHELALQVTFVTASLFWSLRAYLLVEILCFTTGVLLSPSVVEKIISPSVLHFAILEGKHDAQSNYRTLYIE
jgi:hypothetical protein